MSIGEVFFVFFYSFIIQSSLTTKTRRGQFKFSFFQFGHYIQIVTILIDPKVNTLLFSAYSFLSFFLKQLFFKNISISDFLDPTHVQDILISWSKGFLNIFHQNL